MVDLHSDTDAGNFCYQYQYCNNKTDPYIFT